MDTFAPPRPVMPSRAPLFAPNPVKVQAAYIAPTVRAEDMIAEVTAAVSDNVWRQAVEASKAEIAARVECRSPSHQTMAKYVPPWRNQRNFVTTRATFSRG